MAAKDHDIDVMMIGLRSVGGGQGGVERHVACLAAQYERMGLRTCIVVRSPYGANDPSRLGANTWTKSIWAPKHQFFEAPVHSVLATLYAAFKRPRVLHIHAIGPSIATPLARILGLRVVCTHHGEDYAREKWGATARYVLRFGERCQARFAHARICVSKGLSHRLSWEYRVAFEYVPNAVSPMRANPPYSTLAKFGLVPGRYIVNVGRLVPEKRQKDLITAFAMLDRPEYKLVLVGAADHRSQYSSEVEKLATHTPGVIMAGFQQGETLAELIGAAALFVLPSSHEGMPIAALEAMGLDRPVLLSNISPNLELALPAENYHVMGSTEDLAQRLRALLDSNPSDIVPTRDWSSSLVQFTWPIVAQQTVAIYGRVLH